MIALLLAIPILTWDFSTSSHDFVPSGDADQWGHGVPSGGPGGAEQLWGTNLPGLYLNDSVDYLEVPLPDLSSIARPSLVYRHWYEIAPGDSAWIEVDGGTGWARVEPVYGYPSPDGYTGTSEWVEATIDLEAYSGTPRVRFVFEADASFADEGWYLSDVAVWDGDATAPHVTPVVEPGDTQNLVGPYKVQVFAEDDTQLQDVILTWSAGGPDAVIPMIDLGSGLYQGLIPAQDPDTTVSWQVTVKDGGGNVVSWPSAPATFRVYLAAPTGLAVSYDQRPIGEEVTLSWKAPSSPHAVQSYTVQDLGGKSSPISVGDTSVDLVIQSTDPQLWRVAAVYPSGTGDWSSTVDLDLEVPALRSVTPDSAVQGETVHLTLTGTSLYLLEEATSLDLGPGLDVLELDVRDVNTLEAVVFVHGSASPGVRDISVEGGQGRATFEQAFEVLDQDLSMRVLSVSPGTMVQGASGEVVITASEAFAGPVQIQHGDDLVLQTSPVLRGGTELRFEVAVNSDATPGVHTLVLDDGARMLQAELTVSERVYHLNSTGCRTAPLGVGGLGLLGMLGLSGLAVRRRRRPVGRRG